MIETMSNSCNFVTIEIRNIENAYKYAAYLLHKDALFVISDQKIVIPFSLAEDADLIVADKVDLYIVDMLKHFNIIFDIDLNPFMLEFLKTYAEEENIKIIYFSSMEGEFYIDEYINVNGTFTFDDSNCLIKLD